MLISTNADLALLDALLMKAETVVIDTETTGLNIAQGARPIGISFYFPENEGRALIAFESAMRLLEVDPLRKVEA